VSPMKGSEAALVSVNDAVEMALEELAAMAVVTVEEPLWEETRNGFLPRRQAVGEWARWLPPRTLSNEEGAAGLLLPGCWLRLDTCLLLVGR
jgi:hypothetical protein